MWIKDRGGFYCDGCDVSVFEYPRPDYLIGSWFKALRIADAGTIHGAFMLCEKCSVIVLEPLQKRIFSFIPKEVRCDDCGMKQNLVEDPADSILFIHWESESKERRTVFDKRTITLCLRDGTDFLDGIDKNLKYQSRR